MRFATVDPSAVAARSSGRRFDGPPPITIAASIIGVTIGRLFPEHEKKSGFGQTQGGTSSHEGAPAHKDLR
jgi:hypothetical protein